jgi:PAS domain S-box-containing protein
MHDADSDHRDGEYVAESRPARHGGAADSTGDVCALPPDLTDAYIPGGEEPAYAHAVGTPSVEAGGGGAWRAAGGPEAIAESARAFAKATSDYPSLLKSVAERASLLLGDVCLLCMPGDEGRTPAACVVAGQAPVVATLQALFATGIDAAEVGVVCGPGVDAPLMLARVEPGQLAAHLGPRCADVLAPAGVKGLVSVPLRAQGRAFGALVVLRCRPDGRPFDASDVAFAQAVADHGALAIANARLVASLRAEVAAAERDTEEAKTFVALVENSTDLIGMASLDGRILYLNAAGRQLLGLGDTDVTKLALSDFLNDAGLERAERVRDRGAAQGEGVLRHFETGEMIPTRVSTFIARSDKGEALCFATIHTDLRETKALERQLLQSQRLEAIGQLAGGVAHDFNNLLTIIMSYGALAGRALPKGSEAREHIAQIDLAGHRAAALTRQLLTFSRKQVVEPMILDLNEIVTDLEHMVQRTLPGNIEIRLELAPDLGLIRADQGQMEQVILNLVVNARDAMPDGGTLTLGTANVAAAASEGPEPRAAVVLTVRDTGVGFDEATRTRIFEPFFTTKPVGSGTGLGLATVLNIVERSGGWVAAESRPGEGATFRVSLPRAEMAAKVLSPPGLRPSSRPAGGAESILVVEDDAQVRELFSGVLRGSGYRVIDVSSPEAALASSARRDVDLLVTDVILPQMSGRQLADRLSSERTGLRVLYVSGYGEETLAPHGILDSGIELLRKPATPEMLLRSVRRVLDRSAAA